MNKQKEWNFSCDHCGHITVLTKRVRRCPSCRAEVKAVRVLVGLSTREPDEIQKTII